MCACACAGYAIVDGPVSSPGLPTYLPAYLPDKVDCLDFTRTRTGDWRLGIGLAIGLAIRLGP